VSGIRFEIACEDEMNSRAVTCIAQPFLYLF